MFRSGIIMLVLITLATTFIGCAPRAQWQRTVSAAELAQASLEYKWQNIIPLDRGQNVINLYHFDEMVYCLTDDNILLSFNARTGEHVWSQAVFAPGMKILGICHANGAMLPEKLGSSNVIVGTEGDITAKNVLVLSSVSSAMMLDRKDGSYLAQIDFNRAALTGNTPVASDGERIFVGGLRGWVNAFELVNGISAWRAYTVGPVTSAPAVLGNMLYIADENGIVYAQKINKDITERIWPTVPVSQMDSGIVADMAVCSEAVYVGSLDYSVYAFHPTTGKKLWRYRCGGPIRQGLQLGKTNVYALANSDALYALDRAGRETAKWKMSEGVMVLAEIGNETYVLDRGNYMVLVDTETGKPRISMPMTGINLYVANTETTDIFVANSDGLVGCIVKK